MKLEPPLYDGDSILRPGPQPQRPSSKAESLHRRSFSDHSSMDAYTLEVAVRRASWKYFRERIAGFIRKRIAARDARRAARSLEAMSDHELRDIGLQRADVERG